MNRKDIVVTAEREDSSRPGKNHATIRVYVFEVGGSSKWYRTAGMSIYHSCHSDSDGDIPFDNDDLLSTSVDGSNLNELQREIDLLKAFMGRETITTVENVKTALRRTTQGFYDWRSEQWRPASDAERTIYEPSFNWWSEDLDNLRHLRYIYASNEAEAKRVLVQGLLDANRLDLLDGHLRFYEKEPVSHEKPEPIDASKLFVPVPKPEPED